MKLLALLITLVFVLTSCVNSITPTPAPTITPTPVPSPTLAPTFTPTPTPDPNKPPDATGKDAQGNYIKQVEGWTFVWTDVRYGDAKGSHIKEWLRLATPDPIPDMDDREFNPGWPRVGFMQVYLTDNSEQPGNLIYITHPDPSEASKALYSTGDSFSSWYVTSLMKPLHLPRALPLQWWKDFYGGTLRVFFTTPDGVKHYWAPAKKYIVEQAPWGPETDPALHPEWHQNGDPTDPNNPKVQYRWALATDQDNNLIGFFALEDITTSTDWEIAKAIYAPLGEAALHANAALPTYETGQHFEEPVDFITNRSVEGFAHKDFPPHIEIAGR